MPWYGRGLRCGITAIAAATIGASGLGVGGLGAGAAFAEPATGTVRGADDPRAIPGRYIVVFKDGAVGAGQVAATASTRARQFNGTMIRSYRGAVRGFAATLTAANAKRLATDPSVAYVEQDRKVTLAAPASTGTQTGPPSWGLDRIDQRSLPLDGSYTYPDASTVTAYIVDTGVRVTHTEFGGRARSGYDFVDNDANADDCHGHGTHVAGTVGGTSYGVAKNVKLVGVRVLNCYGSGSYSQIIAGIDWVTTNAARPAVVNMSLGGSASDALDAAIRASIASGVSYVVAAGNENTNACAKSPARVADAVTVGATATNDARASFSNVGTCLDLFAPGVGITSAYHAGDTATTSMSGTSMASPHVAGAVALALAANPTATPKQIRDTVVGNATAGVVTTPGTGSPNRLLYTGTAEQPQPPADPAPTTCTKSAKTRFYTPVDRGVTPLKLAVAGCPGTASATSRVEISLRAYRTGAIAVTLVAPDGRVYRPQNLAVRYASGRVVTVGFTVDAAASPRNGTWHLKVADAASRRSVFPLGDLTGWALTV